MRKICVVTGSRAEYGLLVHLMREIAADPDLQLQIVATGMHLSPEFGFTYREIEQDGFQIDEKVEMLLSSDSPLGTAKSVGLGVLGMADAFERLKPHVVVVLGDRFEIFAAAQAAMLLNIPIAHIHGGEITEGAIDDAIRHAITKMSQLHFVALEEYRKRVIQLGENPDRVFCFGPMAADNVRFTPLLSKEQIESSIGFRLGRPTFLVTYHPVTLKEGGNTTALNALFQALDAFPEARVVITKPNADAEGRLISSMIEDYAKQRKQRVLVVSNLGYQRYLSLMAQADVVVGNSSSGILEAPLLRKPTVNIGDRQKGRVAGPSIIHCAESEQEIVAAIRKALSPEFIAQAFPKADDSTLAPSVSTQIKNILKSVDLRGIIRKTFYDIPSKG